ncbi:hypothetical protein P9902_32 [Streptococcus phage P9902]|uniref:Uncharacterized protein n=1 Tax=Streptococcus phage P9902 TaxID=1971448 RepID=A0A286QS81_9CAUD|nr:hypothetical protein PP249_gp32 [Streptococcus phage P9902]ARU14771.1 hypothetical protein P9902_32 [Streptococcus phage P9902]
MFFLAFQSAPSPRCTSNYSILKKVVFWYFIYIYF